MTAVEMPFRSKNDEQVSPSKLEVLSGEALCNRYFIEYAK